MNFKKNADKAIIVAVAVVCAAVSFLGFLKKFDFRLYDTLLSLKENPKTRQEVLLVDIDDYSLEQVGAWPWTRDTYANLLIRMKEFGAASIVFDIEFLSPSNPTVNPNLERLLEDSFANRDSFSTPAEFYDSLKDSVMISYDDLFAESIQFFGNTWLTINNSHLADYTDEDVQYSKTRFLFAVDDPLKLILKGNVKTKFDEDRRPLTEYLALSGADFSAPEEFAPYTEYASGFSPAMRPFISRAAGAGFTNSFIDSDGSRRRVEIFSDKDGGFVAQLAVAPILGTIKPEKIVRTKNSIEIIGAQIPVLDGGKPTGESVKKDISIPLDSDGRMLVNWKHESYNDSFRHTSVCLTTQLDDIESNIFSILSQMDSVDLRDGGGLSCKREIAGFVSDYSTILEYRNYLLQICEGYDSEGNAISGGIAQDTYDEYFSLRRDFFGRLLEFSRGADERAMAELQDYFLENYDMLGEDFVLDNGNWFSDAFDALRSDVSLYCETFDKQSKIFADSFCIIGNVATGTTDFGTMPFSRAYPNVGMHANVYNTIMNEDFITPVDWRWGVLASFVLTLLLVGFVPSKKAFVQILCGIVLIAVVLTVPALLMRTAALYVPVVTPLLIAVLSYLLVTIFRFMSAEKDKKFITNAFGQCLSREVVNQLIADPTSFKLGGENREMTAMFTDIQKFSSFSELLSATQLVALLNYYLTRMSDIIMDERGTVDKYEGDAIVALIGAPLKMDGGEHAVHACAAALKMKKAEILMNEEILKIAASPKPEGMEDDLYDAFRIMVKNKKTLFTRIGLNSGEMTAGYMGSENKKNYTMMGNNVNLASRLEGVNKQYSTGGILISEHTEKLLGDRFIVRPLDRVQVVNVKTPLRLYELVAEREEADGDLIGYMDDWRKALGKFEERDYGSALSDFKRLAKRREGDNVVRYYITLTEKFFAQGKYPTEKDDFGVSFNPENGVFTLLQK